MPIWSPVVGRLTTFLHYAIPNCWNVRAPPQSLPPEMINMYFNAPQKRGPNERCERSPSVSNGRRYNPTISVCHP